MSKSKNNLQAKSWEEYEKTNFISDTVLSAIDSCKAFAADLTHFNHNVLFELGYAIATNKKILIFLNENINDASERYKNSFLRGVNYHKFSNAKDILTPLYNKNYNDGWVKKHVKLETLSPKTNDIFHIESQIPNQASIDLSDFLSIYSEEKNINITSENRTEVQYQPISWYISNIYKSKIVIIHFLGKTAIDYFKHNAFNSFWAGIACGFKREVLLLAPSQYRAPLDYEGIMVQYRDNFKLVDDVEKWLTDRENKCLIVDNEQPNKTEENNSNSKSEKHEFNLLKLGIGCEIAEREKEKLLSYFVETASYHKAKQDKSTIIIGRKGSGKSAIYIKLADEFASQKRLYLVNLKPESDDLLNNIDLSKMYTTDSSRTNFFFSVWKCVIFSKLIMSIYDQITKLKAPNTPFGRWENDIIEYHKNNKKYLNLNFFGVISNLNEEYLSKNEVSTPDILEYLYKHFIGPIKKLIKEYFFNIKNKKYNEIVILADNLDKTWSPTEDLTTQVAMISTLLEIEDKIKKDMPEIKFNLRSILFLRKDIFEYIQKKITEPDKLLTFTHEINWEDYPQKLKEVIENRFRHILDLGNDVNIEKEVWQKYFDLTLKKDEKVFDFIEKIITKRPRDLLYFISKLFESTVNNNRTAVTSEDLGYAIENYTNFLYINIIVEVRANFPEVESILSHLQEYHGQQIQYSTLRKITKDFDYNKEKTERFVEELFKKGYMLGYDEKSQKPFSDANKLKEKLNEKRFFGLRQNKVFIIPHAKYYLIKNQRKRLF